jgi:hypothetical protein
MTGRLAAMGILTLIGLAATGQAATIPNAFVDDEVGPAELIRVAVATFTIP